MTEAEWLASTDPDAMLDHLCRARKVSRSARGRRQLRLFACARCRQV